MKIPKAKCKKCKHCKLINHYGDIDCDFLKATFVTRSKPKRCVYFEKLKELNNNAR